MEQPPEPSIQLSVATHDAIEGLGLDTTVAMPNSLLCAVCLCPAFGGVVTRCEHLFHKKCLEPWQISEPAVVEGKRCPTCRQDAGELKPMGRILADLIGEYSVRCPQGCGGAVDWRRLLGHVKEDCPHTSMICPHKGCAHGPLPRAQAIEHASVCDEALLTCTCSSRVKRKDMETHRDTDCSDVRITCEHCGQPDIKRGCLERHWRKDCKGTATIPVVKSLLDRAKRTSDLTQHRLRTKIRRLEKQVETQSQRLRQLESASQLSYLLQLPKTIEELREAGGPYRRKFGDHWQIKIYPGGDNQPGFVSLFVGLTSEACRHYLVDAKCEVQIGSAKMLVDKVFGRSSAGGTDKPWGTARFAKLEEVQNEQQVKVNLWLKARTELVVCQ